MINTGRKEGGSGNFTIPGILHARILANGPAYPGDGRRLGNIGSRSALGSSQLRSPVWFRNRIFEASRRRRDEKRGEAE